MATNSSENDKVAAPAAAPEPPASAASEPPAATPTAAPASPTAAAPEPPAIVPSAAPAEPAKTEVQAAPPIKEKTLDELMSDPAFARAFQSRQKAALEAAQAAWETEAQQAKERAEMTENERLKAELADATEKAKAAETAAEATKRAKEFGDELLKAGVHLVDGNAVDYVRSLALKLAEDEGLEMSACVKEVLDKNAYLLKPTEAAPAAEPAKPAARTAPAAAAGKQTETPSETEPPKVVDTRDMTPQEYAKYRRTTHGIH